MMVEHVECFGSELEGCSFGELEVLADSQVPVVNAGAADDVTMAVGELASEWLNKRSSVEPMSDAVLATGVSNLIATLRKAQQQTKVVIAKH